MGTATGGMAPGGRGAAGGGKNEAGAACGRSWEEGWMMVSLNAVASSAIGLYEADGSAVDACEYEEPRWAESARGL